VRHVRYIVVMALVLAGCQTTRYEGDERSPYYLVPVGTQLMLHRELTIPADGVGIYIQNGQPVPSALPNIYSAHCKLDLRTRHTEPRTLRPDTFEVTRRYQEQSHSVRLETTQLAAARFSFGLLFGDIHGGGRSLVAFVTRLDLRAMAQPDVFRLSCGHQGYPPEDGHISIAEIRRTLGDLITLQLPAAAR
jgi:hypothetical protein